MRTDFGQIESDSDGEEKPVRSASNSAGRGWPIHPGSCFCPSHTFRRPSFKTRALNLRLDSSLGSSSHHPTLPPLSPYLDRHATVVCESHRFLGDVYSSKGEREKDIHHFEAALKIASPFNWNDQPFWIYHSLADQFLEEYKFYDAHFQIEQAKSLPVANAYHLGLRFDCRQGFIIDNALTFSS